MCSVVQSGESTSATCRCAGPRLFFSSESFHQRAPNPNAAPLPQDTPEEHAHKHKHKHKHKHTHTHTYTRTHAHTHTRARCVCVCAARTRAHAHMRTCARRTRTRTRTWMRTRTRTPPRAPHTCARAHAHSHLLTCSPFSVEESPEEDPLVVRACMSKKYWGLLTCSCNLIHRHFLTLPSIIYQFCLFCWFSWKTQGKGHKNRNLVNPLKVHRKLI